MAVVPVIGTQVLSTPTNPRSVLVMAVLTAGAVLAGVMHDHHLLNRARASVFGRRRREQLPGLVTA